MSLRLAASMRRPSVPRLMRSLAWSTSLPRTYSLSVAKLQQVRVSSKTWARSFRGDELGEVREFTVLDLLGIVPILNVITRSTAVMEVLRLVDSRIIVVGEAYE